MNKNTLLQSPFQELTTDELVDVNGGIIGIAAFAAGYLIGVALGAGGAVGGIFLAKAMLK